jgi:hypothetical protein
MNTLLNERNFVIYAAKHYDKTQIHTTEEFFDDLKRFKYLKKLIARYIKNDDLQHRLILNHIIILYNVFGLHITRMLYLKFKNEFYCIKPFLIVLNILPRRLYNIGDENIIHTDTINSDINIVEKLGILINEKN